MCKGVKSIKKKINKTKRGEKEEKLHIKTSKKNH